MAGSKWNQTCNAIEKFISNLGQEDLVSAIIFNSQATCITQPKVLLTVNEPKKNFCACYIIMFLFFAALMLACIISIFVNDFDKTCYSTSSSQVPVSQEDSGGTVEVNFTFFICLLLLALVYLFESLRFLKPFFPKINKIKILLNFNFLIHICALVGLHYFFFRHEGRVCSGYYATD